MATRRSARALSSFLLRVTERRTEHVALCYELQELRSGRLHRFASLAALARFIGARQRAEKHVPAVASTRTPSPRHKKRK